MGRLTSPFSGFNIDRLLGIVKAQAETVRVCAEGMMEEIILDNHERSKSIQMQLDEVIRQQRTMMMSMNVANGKTHLFQFLLDELGTSYSCRRPTAAHEEVNSRATSVNKIYRSQRSTLGQRLVCSFSPTDRV